MAQTTIVPIPLPPLVPYAVDGVVLPTQPILRTAPALAPVLYAGTTFFLGFHLPDQETLTLLATNTTANLQFALPNGDTARGTVLLQSAYSSSQGFLSVSCTLLVPLALAGGGPPLNAALNAYVQDSFKRGDQMGWGQASNGMNWSVRGSGQLSIKNQEGVLVSQFSDTHVQLGTILGLNSEILCRVAIGNAANDVVGICSRYSITVGVNAYKAIWYGGNLHLNRQVNGSVTQITSVSFPMTPGQFYWLKLVTLGNSLYGNAWASGTQEPGSWLTTTNDTTLTGPGGFAVLGNTGTSTGIQFDTFLALPQ